MAKDISLGKEINLGMNKLKHEDLKLKTLTLFQQKLILLQNI